MMPTSRISLRTAFLLAGTLGLCVAGAVPAWATPSPTPSPTVVSVPTVVSQNTEYTSGNTVINQTGSEGLTYSNGYTLSNDNGASLVNDGSSLYLEGTTTNNGTLTNYNDPNVAGQAYIYNGYDGFTSAAFENSGTINNQDGAYFGNEATLTNAAGGVITNDASGFYNGDENNGATLANFGTFNNQDGAYFENDGTLNNNAGGVINNSGDEPWDGEGLYNYGTLSNSAGATISNTDNGYIENDSTLINNGTITNNDSTFVNGYNDEGMFTNNGIFNNQNDSYFDNEWGATFNYGTFTNDAGSEIYNDDSLFVNDGSLTNAGSLVNMCEATFCNNATLVNALGGTILNEDDSVFNDNGTLLDNAGSIVNERYSIFCENGTLDNSGSFLNKSGSTVYVEGTVNNTGLIENYSNSCATSSFQNNDNEGNGGTINNWGVFENIGGTDAMDDEVAVFCQNSAFNNEAGGVFANSYATVYNEGDFENYGTLNNVNEADFYVYGGLFDNEGTLNNAAYFVNDGGCCGPSFTNEGTLNNSGYFDNGTVAYNLGVITNNGYLENDEVLVNWNFEGAGSQTFNNSGILENDDDANFYNLGIVNNQVGGIINNDDEATFLNGLFVPGTFTNAGTFNNEDYATFQNISGSTLANTGTFNNTDDANFINGQYATLVNSGVFNNSDDFVNNGTVINTGLFDNTDGGLLNEGGIFINRDSLLGGYVYNEEGGTFVNEGSANIAYYYQDSYSKLVIELAPKGADTLNVDGDVDLQGTGGTLEVVYAPGVYTSGTIYKLVNVVPGSGNINGSFGTFDDTATYAKANSEGLAYDYSDPTVELTVDGLEVDPSDDTVYNALRQTVIQSTQDEDLSVFNRLDALGAGLGVDLVDAGGDTQTGAWEKNTGSFAQEAGNNGQPGYQALDGLISAGADQRFGDLLGGFWVGDGQDAVTVTDGEVGTVDTPQLGLYGGWNLGTVVLDAAASYGYDSFTSSRPVFSTGQTASAAFDGQQASGAVQAGAPLSLGGVELEPAVGAGYAWLGTEASDETGAQFFDEDTASQNDSSLRPFAELNAAKAYSLGSWSLNPELNVDYSYETLAQTLGSTELNGTSFELGGPTPTRGQLSVGGGFAAKMTDAVSFIGSYSAVLPTGSLFEQILSLGFRASF